MYLLIYSLFIGTLSNQYSMTRAILVSGILTCHVFIYLLNYLLYNYKYILVFVNCRLPIIREPYIQSAQYPKISFSPNL